MRTDKATFSAELIPESFLATVDWVQVFGRAAPLEVDLGCGDGSFLAARAQQHPERHFVGVERLVGRVRSASQKVEHRQLNNARVVRFEILHAVQQLFAPESVALFYLMFPDPWPKRRHQNRRVVTPEFWRAATRALEPNGELHVATDQADYFKEMEQSLREVPILVRAPDWKRVGLPASTFESHFCANGAEIYRLALRKSAIQESGGRPH